MNNLPALTPKVICTDSYLADLSTQDFNYDGAPAALALAYISSHLDFEELSHKLKVLAANCPLLAVSTAGALCANSQGDPLYISMQAAPDHIVVQIFPPDLFASAQIVSIPLHNEDIRYGSFTMHPEKRILKIKAELEALTLQQEIDVRDTVALVYVDGLSSCENYLMEAIYLSKRFPCMFVGGSSAGTLDYKHTYIFDGNRVVENTAVMVFLKLAPNRGYTVMKTHNFERTEWKFEVADAEPERRCVYAVYDTVTHVKRPFAHYFAQKLGIEVSHLAAYFKKKTFALHIGDEYFVRSVSGVNAATGAISFYCDVNPGDVLHLVKSIDLERCTAKAIRTLLADRPPALGAILHDCILRRLNNNLDQYGLSSAWPIPVAGFSTFGEIFGINVNETLSALVFFDTSQHPDYVDQFIKQFPIYYAAFSEYFHDRQQQTRLNLALHINNSRAQQFQNLGVSQAIDIGLVTINAAGIMLMVNHAATKIFGYDAHEMLGHNVKMLMPEPDRSAHDGYVANFVHTGHAKIAETGREVFAMRKDGSYFPMHLAVTKLIEDGEMRFVGICRDLTEVKQQEAQRVAERNQAIDANKAKSSFLAHMSHELRTPLNGLLGMLQLLHDTALSPEQQDLLGNAQVSGEGLLEIVNDVLDISKIEAGGLTLEAIGFSLKQVAQNVQSILTPLANRKHLSLHLKVPQELPYVIGDPLRMRQVMLNLVGNAIKYTIHGSVSLAIEIMHQNAQEVQLRVSITDTGIGIASDKLDKVFESFSQADPSTTREFGGTGLGLTITKKLVEMMQGTIAVRSALGQGSCFWFELALPVTDSLYQARFQAHEMPHKGRIPPAQARVLIAEDIPMNTMLMRKAMQKFGITGAIYVTNGMQAVEAYASGEWDVILMDCFMPEMTGYEATRAIRAIEKTGLVHVPIVAMTANAMAGDREECLRSGMDYYLAKPIQLDDLRTMFSRWIDFEHVPG